MCVRACVRACVCCCVDDELAAEVEQEYEARQQHEEDDFSSALEALAVDESAPSRGEIRNTTLDV